MSIDGRKAGRIGGRKNVESGHLANVRRIANHNRWHVARGIQKEDCKFCFPNEVLANAA
jgi:hypothetical protein